MRAVAILIVFLSHAAPYTGVQSIFGLHVVIPGPFGVTIFFFLSGYLITTLMRAEHERAGRIDLRAFYLRRVIRIFPPLYFTLAATWLLCALDVMDFAFPLNQLAAASLQVGNYWMILHHDVYSLPPGLGVLWSLAVEEHFYLVFPLIFIALSKTRWNKAAAIWTLCAICFVWRAILVRRGVDPLYIMMATDARFDCLLFGCALALRGNPVMDPTRFSRTVWLCALLPLGFVLMGSSHFFPGAFREASKYTVQGIGLTLVFSAIIRHPPSILNSRPAVWLGGISYSLYLTHGVIIHLLPFEHGSWQMYLLGLALSLVIACLLHVFVERPSRHRVRVSIPSGELEKLATSQKSNAA